jgi:hypothetical protein
VELSISKARKVEDGRIGQRTEYVHIVCHYYKVNLIRRNPKWYGFVIKSTPDRYACSDLSVRSPSFPSIMWKYNARLCHLFNLSFPVPSGFEIELH